MRCIEVFTQRSLVQPNACIFRHLYLFKIYIVSEWITHQSSTFITTSSQYDTTIKDIMEGKRISCVTSEIRLIFGALIEMYLVKDQLSHDDLWCCQIVSENSAPILITVTHAYFHSFFGQ